MNENNNHIRVHHFAGERQAVARCSCGWSGTLDAMDIRKSWLGHLRRVGATLAHKGADYGVEVVR